MIRRSLLLLVVLSAAAVYAQPTPNPVILSLNPSSAVVGTGSFTLHVSGANFINGTAVRWNGSNRFTTFIDSGHLDADINGSDILSPNNIPITVFTPTGLLSDPVNFQVLPNSPSISSINPTTVSAGSPGFTLQVTGQNFANTTVINVNNSPRTTTYIDGQHLTTEMTSSDVSFQRTLNINVTNPSFKQSNTVQLQVTLAAPNPTITLLNPNTVNAGSLGFTLQVVGTGFVNGAVIRFGTVNKPTTFVGSSHLTTPVSSSEISSPGTISVTVVNPGNKISSAATLTIAASGTPTIQIISPDHVNINSPGFTLTVIGTGFVVGDHVLVRGVSHNTTFVDSTHLTAPVFNTDVNTAGEVPITVAAPNNGPVSNAVSLFVIAANAPLINSISPTSVAVGSPDTKILINGTNFKFDDIVKVEGAPHTSEFISATQMTVTVLAAEMAQEGSLQIVVVRNDGTATSAPATLAVTNAQAPSITSLAPSSAGVNSPPFILAVNGINFENGAVVTVDNTPRTTTFVNINQLAVGITAADLATVRQLPIFVTNPGGGTSQTVLFNVVLPVPTITSLNPSSVISGDSGFQLTVSGSNFSSQSVINVNGTARSTQLQNATGALTTQIAASEITAPTSLSITVSANGATSNVVLLPVLRPAITSVTPASLPFGSTTATLTVAGTSFLTTSKIIFRGIERTTTYNPLDGTLSATLDANDLKDSGQYGVTVKNSADSFSQPFIIQISSPGDPIITSVTPSTIIAGSGLTKISVVGQNFTPTSVVRINGGVRQFTFVNSAQLDVTILPSDIAFGGTLSIEVTNPDGKVTPAFSVTVTGPPPPAPPRGRIVRH